MPIISAGSYYIKSFIHMDLPRFWIQRGYHGIIFPCLHTSYFVRLDFEKDKKIKGKKRNNSRKDKKVKWVKCGKKNVKKSEKMLME